MVQFLCPYFLKIVLFILLTYFHREVAGTGPDSLADRRPNMRYEERIKDYSVNPPNMNDTNASFDLEGNGSCICFLFFLFLFILYI